MLSPVVQYLLVGPLDHMIFRQFFYSFAGSETSECSQSKSTHIRIGRDGTGDNIRHHGTYLNRDRVQRYYFVHNKTDRETCIV
jgi:hypothetical protein